MRNAIHWFICKVGGQILDYRFLNLKTIQRDLLVVKFGTYIN